MRKTIDIVVSAFLLLAGAGLLSMTFSGDFKVRTFGGDVGPAFAPRLFLVVWVLLAAIALVQAVKSEPEGLGDIRWSQFFWIVGISAATAYAMVNIGFVFAMVPGLAAFMWAFAYRKPLPVLIISILVPIAVWALFTFGFELLLPRSPWLHQI